MTVPPGQPALHQDWRCAEGCGEMGSCHVNYNEAIDKARWLLERTLDETIRSALALDIEDWLSKVKPRV